MDWGGDRGDTEFSVVGGQSGALCRWIGVVIGVIRNFLSWVGNLGLCEAPPSNQLYKFMCDKLKRQS